MKTDEILGRLPHAYPFRMIDRILEVEAGKRAIALKNVSGDELFLQGHLPEEPAMPAVLLLEAMAQTGGMAFQAMADTGEESLPFLAGIDEFRLRRKVIPGDQILLEATVERIFSNLTLVRVVARVGGEVVAEGRLILARGSTVET